MKITVTPKFIEYRADKKEQYNQRNRTDRKFLMDLDAEIYEHHMLSTYRWLPHPSWMVDAINERGQRIDVKFIRRYWNVSREKTLNLIKQRNAVERYDFYEWVFRPNRPLKEGDTVEVNRVGSLDYDTVADNLKKSFKEPDGFYVDVRTLLGVHGKKTERRMSD